MWNSFTWWKLSWVGRWKWLYNRLSSITMNTSDCSKSSFIPLHPCHTLNVIMKMELCSGENIVILFNDFYECSVSCPLCNPITRSPYNDSFMECSNRCCVVIVIYWNGYIYDCHQYVSHSNIHTYHTKISSIEIQKIKKKEEIMWLVIFHLMYLRARQRDRLHSEPTVLTQRRYVTIYSTARCFCCPGKLKGNDILYSVFRWQAKALGSGRVRKVKTKEFRQIKKPTIT